MDSTPAGQEAITGPTHVPAKVPMSGDVINVMLSQVTMAVITFCLTRRIQAIKSWRTLPPSSWLAILIYWDSFFFVLFTAVVSKGLGINTSRAICEGGIILCLVCYVTTKVMMYLFLVEKAYLVRGNRIPRVKETQYRWNFLGIVITFTAIIALNFVFRIARIDGKGQCIIGMKKVAMIPLISFEILVNVYLTTLFIIPLRSMSLPSSNYSLQKTNPALQKMVVRSFVGSCTTLTSSVSNLTVLMVLGGEPGWICLMLCNADVLFSVAVLHWVTSFDSLRSRASRKPGGENQAGSNGQDEGCYGGTTRTRMSTMRPCERRVGGVDLETALGTRCSDTNGRMTRAQIRTEIRAGSQNEGADIALDTIDIQTRTEQRREAARYGIDCDYDNDEEDDGRECIPVRVRADRMAGVRHKMSDLEMLEEDEADLTFLDSQTGFGWRGRGGCCGSEKDGPWSGRSDVSEDPETAPRTVSGSSTDADRKGAATERSLTESPA